MTLTHKIYTELYNDSENLKSQISKRYNLCGDNYVIYAVSLKDKCRHLYFEIDNDSIDNIPKCKGIILDSVQLIEYNNTGYFCDMSQAIGSEDYIFETIIEDIRSRLINSKSNTIVSTVSFCLRKWQDFFARNKEILMSDERQQGLYGELRFLNELISTTGSKAVTFWVGCKYETHDFYIQNNAFEVKTSTTKAPYKMRISSEYQLDPKDSNGSVFIRFFALRKSEADGEKLPELIEKIRTTIQADPYSLENFNKCLEEYGYFDSVSDKYTTGYTERENQFFKVKGDFPRITKENLLNGVSNCTYDISVDCCKPYTVDLSTELQKIMEG